MDPNGEKDKRQQIREANPALEQIGNEMQGKKQKSRN